MTDTPGDVAAKLEQSLVPFATWDGGRAIQVGLGTYDTKQIDISLRDLRAAASMLRDMSEREKALREALGEIAKQVPAKDMDEDYYEAADFEHGYDSLIFIARAALEAK